jgi:transposase
MTVPFSAPVYRRRHRVENFFQRIKRYRRVATRYDKLAETFLGFVCLAILFTLRLT